MRTRVVAGVGAIVVVLGAAWVAPQIVGGLLLLFSVLVFVLTIAGLTRTVEFPERMSPLWGFAVAFGLYLGGVILIAPPNGVAVSSDRSQVEFSPDRPPVAGSGLTTPEERRQRAEARRRRQERIDGRTTTMFDQLGRSAPDPGVSALTWTDGPWPLTVSAGTLSCFEVGGQEAAFIAAPESDVGGFLGVGEGWAMWPLNGVASTHHARYGAKPDLFPIWADNPVTGLKINIGPMIARARELCR